MIFLPSRIRSVKPRTCQHRVFSLPLTAKPLPFPPFSPTERGKIRGPLQVRFHSFIDNSLVLYSNRTKTHSTRTPVAQTCPDIYYGQSKMLHSSSSPKHKCDPWNPGALTGTFIRCEAFHHAGGTTPCKKLPFSRAQDTSWCGNFRYFSTRIRVIVVVAVFLRIQVFVHIVSRRCPISSDEGRRKHWTREKRQAGQVCRYAFTPLSLLMSCTNLMAKV